jgi:Lsr2
MGAAMVKRTVVELDEDDLDGGPATETLSFGFEGIGYSIDLSKKNADRFRKLMAPYLNAARRDRGGATVPGHTASSLKGGADEKAVRHPRFSAPNTERAIELHQRSTSKVFGRSTLLGNSVGARALLGIAGAGSASGGCC